LPGFDEHPATTTTPQTATTTATTKRFRTRQIYPWLCRTERKMRD
jgi:hypothetical protein